MAIDDAYIIGEWISMTVKNQDVFSSVELEVTIDCTLEDGIKKVEKYIFSGVKDLQIDDLLSNNVLYLKIEDISDSWLGGLYWNIVGFEMDNPISFKCKDFSIQEL